MKKELEEFAIDFVRAIKDNNAVVFAGAGLSVASGYFDWKQLLAPIAVKMNLDIRDEHDLTLLAQFFIDNKGGRGKLNQILAEEFHKAGIQITENHKILARLPIGIYWTTNFDSLIEESIKAAGKTPDVKRSQDDLSINLPKRDAIVYKMHGDINDISRVVLTKHDYEDYYKTRELFANAFKADFVSRTMLFIGFSFSDPNLDYLMSRIRTIQGTNKKPDYYFIKNDTDPKKQNRQKIKAKTLEQYGLQPLWIDDYSEITLVLKEIERRLLRSVVFISGSAIEYGGLSQIQGQLFIQELSQQLSGLGFKIVSGFGLGVGSSVINGVLENMKKERNQNLDHYLILRPFPQTGPSSEVLKENWKLYRESFIPLAGIAVFLFGNKHSTNGVALADGLMQEFEIAVKNGLRVIPIGSTGYMAKNLHAIVAADFERYYPDHPTLIEDFMNLGKEPFDGRQVISTVLRIVALLNS